nr:MAG TPA: hypothetical protein [Caudoviricetes sp.]
MFKVYHVTCLLSSIVLGLLANKFKVLLLPNYSLDLIQVYQIFFCLSRVNF